MASSSLAGCGAPKITDDNANYALVKVTPALVSQMQLEQQQKHVHTSTTHKDTYSYKLGVGDVLYTKLYIPSTAHFDGPSMVQDHMADNWQEYNEVLVKDDGNVSFPYVGELHLANKTLSEAKKTLDGALAKYFKRAQSVLEIKDFKSQKIQITGEVRTAGEQYLHYDALDVLKAIQNAGGLLDTADSSNATIAHKDGNVEKVDLFAIMNNGNMHENHVLVNGDTLNIPANGGNKVFVIGEVNKPSLQYIKAGHMTVMEALSASQGPNSISASYEHIYVVRSSVANESPITTDQTGNISLPHAKIYQLDGSDGLGLALAAQFPLQPSDVVYVSPTLVNEWGVFINQLLPSDLAVLGEAAILAPK